MAMSDYYRPAEWQIRKVARCSLCKREDEYPMEQSLDGAKCYCGGDLRIIGESYPARAEDWEEERYPNGEWGERRF